MPRMPKHRKAKRVTVLTKRTQYMKKHYKERSYRPLYEKLKNNNSYLAKALSQEKQNSQSVFSQNIALIAEVQELRLACNTRNNIISNVLNNAKEMLKMLVTMSGYVTNTISICQEFAASSTNLRLSSASVGRKESSRRLSIKSPARGVVKPMVSGHTITKPTINLSRVNMENINNSSRLSVVEEVTTPNRSQEMNESRSPIAVSIPITQLRYENARGRTCRMPERLVVSSPRVNTEEEQILRRRRHHSKRLSGSYSRSRSNRWSGESTRNSAGRTNQLGSPRVKLNDVSKLLQNCQSINIRTLINNRVHDIGNQESSDAVPHDTSDRNIISETEVLSINPNEEDELYAQTPKRSLNAQTSRKTSDKNINKSLNITENSRLNNDASLEDPLEGPSWLFNDTLTVPSQDERRSDRSNVSGVNNRTLQSNSKVIEYSDESSDVDDIEEELSPLQNLTKRITDIQIQKRDYVADMRDDSLGGDTANDSYCTILPTAPTSDRERSFNDAENNNTTNFASFVTMRRGHSQLDEEETEDFTLLLSHRPVRDMHFDINELRLPVLEQSIINSTTATNEIDSEVTTAIQRITNIQIPSISNRSINELDLDPTTTIKLPLILANDRVSTPEKSKSLNQKNKNTKTASSKSSTNQHVEDAVTIKDKTKRKKTSDNNQDPSTAKVVLEKLNQSRVKPGTPLPDDIRSQNNSYTREIIFNQEGNSFNTTIQETTQNSESSNDSTSSRPKRRKAPVNLKEPSLQKKLRRNW